DLGLDDDFVAGQCGEHGSKLHFRGAVAARGLDVVDAEFNRPVNGRLEILLIGARDILGVNILPFVLITHPPAGNDGHGKFRPAKASIFHVPKLWHKKVVSQRRRNDWARCLRPMSACVVWNRDILRNGANLECGGKRSATPLYFDNIMSTPWPAASQYPSL